MSTTGPPMQSERSALRLGDPNTFVHGVPVEKGSIMAAFGCNFEGDISIERVLLNNSSPDRWCGPDPTRHGYTNRFQARRAPS